MNCVSDECKQGHAPCVTPWLCNAYSDTAKWDSEPMPRAERTSHWLYIAGVLIASAAFVCVMLWAVTRMAMP